MDIYSRFKALPRARKGTTTVVIAEEAELERLIADAQASEAAMIAGVGPANPNPMTSISGGATGGAPMVIHVDLPPPPGADVVIREEIHRSAARARRGRTW